MTNHSNSRTDKYEKRRRNSKLIKYSLSLAAILVLFLVAIWIFGGGEDEVSEEDTELNDEETFFLEVDEEEVNDSAAPRTQEEELAEETENNSLEISENGEDKAEEEQDVIIEETESTDDNVKEAITGNWPPIGTTQTGPHTTIFNDGSQDRIEIKQAVSMATNIPEENLIEWWVGNGGDQKVVATVSDQEETETYRVYLQWVDNEGWQPIKIETLIVNDKKKGQ